MSELILITEDSPTQAELLKYILEKNNYQVSIAKNGLEALASIRQKKPAMVISDIVMPEMNGYDLCRSIKADDATGDIPVILLTFLSNSEDVLEGIECGADHFLTKPYSEEYLISLMQRIFANKQENEHWRDRIEVEIQLHGIRRVLKAGQQQMLTLLMSAYEAAIQKNYELIQSQDKLRVLNENLEELTSELSTANAQKDKFFSIIAHDLRSPFNGLLGLTEMMASGEVDFSKAELAEFSKSIYASTSNLYRLLENLLEWAQMQKDSISFNPEELTLQTSITQCVDTIIQKARQKGISIVLDVPDNQKVYADEKMLSTVLRNLLSNAVKFTRKDGKIIVRVLPNESMATVDISVTDTGVGMSEESIGKLFRIEEKVGSRGTDGEPSTGLGLLLCKEFVEKQGGEIRVESSLGEGSTFTFTLPSQKEHG